MGIRFACHVCSKRLNVKQELAGRRGICPSCSTRFRIPLADAPQSTPIESPAAASPAEASPDASPSAEAAVANEPPGSPTPAPPAPSAPPAPRPSLLDEDPQARWYVRPPGGGQYGPATAEEFRRWIDEGRVAASALLWKDDWPQWRDASEALPEFADKLPEAPTTGNGPSVTAGQPSSNPAEVEQPSGDPAGKDSADSGQWSGKNDVGGQRRSRSNRRVAMIAFLSVLAIALLATLIVVANLQG